jgi:glycosyltransferase involved in cell wall biosynthesis
MMDIVLFSHPAFMDSQSMPRFTKMLEQAYIARGHEVQVWAPKAFLYHLMPNCLLSKWAGYIDQYVFFPLWVRMHLIRHSKDTLYVFSDQALGPWVPLVKHRPHVVHVHDLLALRSALGEFPENPTTFSGQLYQRYIRRGFKQAKHFISISQKTREDLQNYGQVDAVTSEVVYNGINYPYRPMPVIEAMGLLMQMNFSAEPSGMLLHVSGNQWYKNVPGVIRIYAEYAKNHDKPLPLWLVGCSRYKAQLQLYVNGVPPQGKVLFLTIADNHVLQAAYSLSRAFLFPSFAEGFGWPIIEAQACGCSVLTTDMPPMIEIGGPTTRYIPLLRAKDDVNAWATNAAKVLDDVLKLSDADRAALVSQAVTWSQNFDADTAIEGYLRVYQQVMQWQATH